MYADADPVNGNDPTGTQTETPQCGSCNKQKQSTERSSVEDPNLDPEIEADKVHLYDILKVGLDNLYSPDFQEQSEEAVKDYLQDAIAEYGLDVVEGLLKAGHQEILTVIENTEKRIGKLADQQVERGRLIGTNGKVYQSRGKTKSGNWVNQGNQHFNTSSVDQPQAWRNKIANRIEWQSELKKLNFWKNSIRYSLKVLSALDRVSDLVDVYLMLKEDPFVNAPVVGIVFQGERDKVVELQYDFFLMSIQRADETGPEELAFVNWNDDDFFQNFSYVEVTEGTYFGLISGKLNSSDGEYVDMNRLWLYNNTFRTVQSDVYGVLFFHSEGKQSEGAVPVGIWRKHK